MTEAKEEESLRTAGDPAVTAPPETGAPGKKAPRRKVAARGKLAAEPPADGAAETVKVKSRGRKPKALAAVTEAAAAPFPAADPEPMQPELSLAAPSLSPDASRASAEKTVGVVEHPGQPETAEAPAAVPAPALDNTSAPAPVAAAGLLAPPPEMSPAVPAPGTDEVRSAEAPTETPAGSLAAPAAHPEPVSGSRDGASTPSPGQSYQTNNQPPPGARYSDQERTGGDRRGGQDRYPRQQQHGQQPQRHGQQPQHRSFQTRGDSRPQQQYGGQREPREPREPRGEGQYGGQREPREPRGEGQYGGQPQQPSSQDGGADPLVSRVTETQYGEGIVEVSGKGFGFLREAKRNFVQTPADVFVTPEVCRKYNLRDGQWIKGEIRRSSRGPQLFRLTALNGEDPEKYRDLPNFEELTTINPKKRIRLETVSDRYTTRVMDLMTPIGKGQRGLIVAPPRTGKTTLLQHIAEAVVKNHPEMKLIILLVDERPEEVTEIRRTVPQAEMMASSNDSDLKSHTRIAQLAMERAKRLVEANFDVFILLDSITRVGRAFNNAITGGGGRTMSGGIDARAMEIPRKIFAAARNTEEAGSLTIMATALIDTGSKMDEVIFQEFKGTGNMELVLDRKISDQRIYPAVDIFLSGTRREELLLQPWELDKINVIRRGLAGHKPIEAIERLLTFLKKFPTNAQMLTSLPG